MTNFSCRALLSLSVVVLVFACSSSDPETAEPRAGASCAGMPADTMRCDGPKSGLFCKNGTWTTTTCHGAGGCAKVGEDKIVCDSSISEVGDDCTLVRATEIGSCSVDGTKLLTCADGKFVVQVECTGAEKCRVEGDTAKCDQTTSTVGAACLMDGNYACTADGTKLLVCTAGKFTVDEDCAAKSASCKLADGTAGCK